MSIAGSKVLTKMCKTFSDLLSASCLETRRLNNIWGEGGRGGSVCNLASLLSFFPTAEQYYKRSSDGKREGDRYQFCRVDSCNHVIVVQNPDKTSSVNGCISYRTWIFTE
jgi:hypothetical protein